MNYKYTSIKLGNKHYGAIINEITERSIIKLDIVKNLDKNTNIIINGHQLSELSGNNARNFIEIILEFSLAKRIFRENFFVIRELGLSKNIILGKTFLRSIGGRITSNRECTTIETDTYFIYLYLTHSSDSDQNPATSRKNKHEYYI